MAGESASRPTCPAIHPGGRPRYAAAGRWPMMREIVGRPIRPENQPLFPGLPRLMPTSPAARHDLLRSLLNDRILMLDGAMGTMVHALGLDEGGFRGERFADHHRDLKNCIDVLVLT